MDFTTLFVLSYFVLLALTLRKRWGIIQGPWLFFFRAFFPNWKFYHGINPAPRLYVRGHSELGTWSHWYLIYPRLPRKLIHLVHNPAVNLALTHQNLVDHLANDINDLPDEGDVRTLVTYQLVTQLARQAMQGGCWGDQPMIADNKTSSMTGFQFEVRMELPEGDDSQTMLKSPVMPLWN